MSSDDRDILWRWASYSPSLDHSLLGADHGQSEVARETRLGICHARWYLSRTVATFVSCADDFALVLVNRSFATSIRDLIGKNRALVWVATITVALLVLILMTSVGRRLFRFGPLHADDLTLIFVIIVAIFATLEFLKRFWRTRLVA